MTVAVVVLAVGTIDLSRDGIATGLERDVMLDAPGPEGSLPDDGRANQPLDGRGRTEGAEVDRVLVRSAPHTGVERVDGGNLAGRHRACRHQACEC